MEKQEESGKPAKGEPKEKSSSTKIVAIVFLPDGKCIVKKFTIDKPVGEDFVLNGATSVSVKSLETVPKRYKFLETVGEI